jgi:hypothetical protein
MTLRLSNPGSNNLLRIGIADTTEDEFFTSKDSSVMPLADRTFILFFDSSPKDQCRVWDYCSLQRYREKLQTLADGTMELRMWLVDAKAPSSTTKPTPPTMSAMDGKIYKRTSSYDVKWRTNFAWTEGKCIVRCIQCSDAEDVDFLSQLFPLRSLLKDDDDDGILVKRLKKLFVCVSDMYLDKRNKQIPVYYKNWDEDSVRAVKFKDGANHVRVFEKNSDDIHFMTPAETDALHHIDDGIAVLDAFSRDQNDDVVFNMKEGRTMDRLRIAHLKRDVKDQKDFDGFLDRHAVDQNAYDMLKKNIPWYKAWFEAHPFKTRQVSAPPRATAVFSVSVSKAWLKLVG